MAWQWGDGGRGGGRNEESEGGREERTHGLINKQKEKERKIGALHDVADMQDRRPGAPGASGVRTFSRGRLTERGGKVLGAGRTAAKEQQSSGPTSSAT